MKNNSRVSGNCLTSRMSDIQINVSMKEAIYFRQKLFPGECFLMCVAGKGSRLEFFVGTITHMAAKIL